MNGLDNIITYLGEDCQRQCDEIESSAAATAAGIIEDAQKKAAVLVADAEKDARREAEKLILRAKSQSMSESRQTLLKARVELINDTLANAKTYLSSLNTDDYFKVLFSLAARLRRKGEGTMYLNKRDLDRLPSDFVARLGADIKISTTPADIADGFILSYGDIEMNCTFDALFAEYSDELKEKAAQILFA